MVHDYPMRVPALIVDEDAHETDRCFGHLIDSRSPVVATVNNLSLRIDGNRSYGLFEGEVLRAICQLKPGDGRRWILKNLSVDARLSGCKYASYLIDWAILNDGIEIISDEHYRKFDWIPLFSDTNIKVVAIEKVTGVIVPIFIEDWDHYNIVRKDNNQLLDQELFYLLAHRRHIDEARGIQRNDDRRENGRLYVYGPHFKNRRYL